MLSDLLVQQLEPKLQHQLLERKLRQVLQRLVLEFQRP
jgi:hypothetical protein